MVSAPVYLGTTINSFLRCSLSADLEPSYRHSIVASFGEHGTSTKPRSWTRTVYSTHMRACRLLKVAKFAPITSELIESTVSLLVSL